LVQIQDGCDNFCSYCIIAAARGGSKNRDQEEIIQEINDHVAHGFNEAVLTGINIGAYGASMTTKAEENHFAELLEAILDQTEVGRVRISSLGPEFFNEKWFEILKHPRICRHIHLSIQSGSSSVLERMRRFYDAPTAMQVVKRLQKEIPGIAITTDFIAGFPEESEAEFKETLDFVEEAKLAKAHVFPYSERQNTLASKMKQIPIEYRKARARQLQELADELRNEFIQSQIGQTVGVLWEQCNGAGVYEGLTDNYIRVKQKGGHCPLREITEVELTQQLVAE
jgi:threonylcarbamoyladenosine tRNA methylthiotransferase MtaB